MSCIDAIVEREHRLLARVERVNNIQANIVAIERVKCAIARKGKITALVDRVCRIGKYLLIKPNAMWIQRIGQTEVISNVDWNIN